MTSKKAIEELVRYVDNLKELLSQEVDPVDLLEVFEQDNDGQIIFYTSVFKKDDGSYEIDY